MKTAKEYQMMTNKELLDELRKDEYLRGYILACICNWHNDPFDKEFEALTYNDECRFEDFNPSTVMYWTRKYLDRRMRIEESESYKNAREQERLEREAKEGTSMEAWLSNIPKQYADASIDDFRSDNQPKIVNGILNGMSFIVCGDTGRGKTRIGWACCRRFKEQGKTAEFRKMFELMQDISSKSGEFRDVADYISFKYVHGLDVLLIDEIDKAKMTDSVYQYLSYLIDRRCEELRQTVLFCNASDRDSLLNKVGSAIASRFRSKKWKANVVLIGGEDVRPLIE